MLRYSLACAEIFILLVQASLRAPHVVADEAKLAIVFIVMVNFFKL